MHKRNLEPPIKLSKAEIARITAQQKKEFPGDMALQVVHISRKILMREAELMGMEFGEYMMFLDKYENNTQCKTNGAENRP